MNPANDPDEQKQGFSSEQQPQPNLITIEKPEQQTELQTQQKSRIRTNYDNISPPQDIKKKQYSLQPDMLTGWKPKIYLPKPIPLVFYNDQLDCFIQTLIKLKTYPPKKQENREENKFFVQLVYLGPRYQSTYSAWYQKPFPFPYTHMNKNKRLKFTDRQFVGQYWNAQTQNHLHFDSFFQSGNLQVVFKTKQYQYDLFMRVDSNTMGHLHWYNFKVKNMKKDITYKYNICNFLKAKSLYSRGMKPYIFSKRKHQFQNIGWIQAGQNIQYEKRMPKSFKILKKQIDSKPYCLSFEYLCEYQNDEVQFSYCIPYEYSRLQEYIEQLQSKYASKNYVKISRLTYSLGGLDIPIITITSDLKQKIIDFDNNKKGDKISNNINLQEENINKKLVVASGRIHPGESNGSFMIQGFIDYLCQQTQESQKLRDSIVFKIIPMLNPDGVVLGNYRTSLSGKDLNRQFINPDQYVFPQVYHLKKYLGKLTYIYKRDFLMYLDFHGHSTKKNCFTYGPEFPITNSNYYQCRIFPKLISMKSQMFRYFSCIFKISEFKQQTLRAVLLKQYLLDLVYTIEVSNGCFYNHQQLKDVAFDDKKWFQMGNIIGKSLNQYFGVVNQIQMFKIRKKEERLKLKKNREKVRFQSSLMKRQSRTPSKNRDRKDMRLTRNQFYSKPKNSIFGMKRDSPSKISKLDLSITSSPYKKNNFQQFSLRQPQIQLENNIFQNLPNFQDDNINFLLKQIYTQKKKPSQKGDNNFSLFDEQNKLENDKKSVCSDDNISQGGSDSSSSSQDLNNQYKQQLFKSIKSGSQSFNAFYLKNKRKRNKDPFFNKNFSEYNGISDFSQTQNQNPSNQNGFLTDFTSNQLDQIDQISNIKTVNSIKLNQLRSKRHIYLKKKSYNQINFSSSPKKQQKNLQTAKIINFEFSLHQIKPSSYGFYEKQKQSNSIHSLMKQTSQEKIDNSTRKEMFQYEYQSYHNQTEMQRMKEYEEELLERKRTSSMSALNIRKLKNVGSNNNNPSTIIASNPSIMNTTPTTTTFYPKKAYFSLLKRTQQKKPVINSTFYQNSKPLKNIQGDIKGKRLLSGSQKSRCKTQINQY